MKQESKKERVEALVADMQKVCYARELETVKRCAEMAVTCGWRKERHGEWVKDNTYEGKQKEIYTCSCCGHYEAIKKGNDKLRYMNYCPDCGALMKKPEEVSDNGNNES